MSAAWQTWWHKQSTVVLAIACPHHAQHATPHVSLLCHAMLCRCVLAMSSTCVLLLPMMMHVAGGAAAVRCGCAWPAGAAREWFRRPHHVSVDALNQQDAHCSHDGTRAAHKPGGRCVWCFDFDMHHACRTQTHTHTYTDLGEAARGGGMTRRGTVVDLTSEDLSAGCFAVETWLSPLVPTAHRTPPPPPPTPSHTITHHTFKNRSLSALTVAGCCLPVLTRV